MREDIGYISGKKWPFVEIKVSLEPSQHNNVIFEGFTHFHALLHTLAQFKHNFHAICDIFANFDQFSTCLVSKSMYSSWGIQWLYFHTPSNTLYNLQAIWAILAIFNMLGIKKPVFKLRKLMVILSNTHAFLHTIYTQFSQIQANSVKIACKLHENVWSSE